MVKLKKCFARLPQETNPSIGNPHTSMVPFEKRYPELIFQFPHATTDGRLPDAQYGRNAAKTQLLSDKKCLSY